jgi:tetratricopeptide (TPR) repeat protein
MDSKTEEAIRSFQIDGAYEQVMKMTDSLTNLLKDALLISRLQKVGSVTLHDLHNNTASSPEAYRCFLQGQIAFYKNDMSAAIDWYKQAMAIDSNLNIMGRIALAYFNNGDIVEGKKWTLKNYGRLDKMNTHDKIWARFVYASFFQTPKEIIKCMHELKDIDDKNPVTYFNTGDSYLNLKQYDKAIIEFETALDIFDKWGIKPNWIAYYAELGIAYHSAGLYKKEKKLYKKADRDFPDVPDILDQKAYLALKTGKIEEGNKFIEQWSLAMKGQSWSDGQIANYLASYVYEMAGMPDKREEYYRQALSLDPENPSRIVALAFFLIDTDRNINEGMELAEKALELRPDSYGALRCKGWGLYHQGKKQEALHLLQKSWDLRMKNSVYNHQAFLDLEDVKKAIARN